jgi:hypothetical protein
MDRSIETTEGWEPNAQLALDTINMKPTKGIPTALVHIMDIPFIEEFSGHKPGAFRQNPDEVYVAFNQRMGTSFIDQYLADNPLTMGTHGYEATAERGATTGAENPVLDGITIDGPEAVIRHLEEVVFPDLQERIADYESSSAAETAKLISGERALQERFGNNLLKVPYHGFLHFPMLRYYHYGYVPYFQAYALYPEVMERDFCLQADLAEKENRVAARAFVEGGLPPLIRLDHDLADERGTIPSLDSLERLWFPQMARAIRPLLDAGIRLIWHCDGNLMEMIPPLLEIGLGGFQGFQYECGMDYQKICRLKDRRGEPLFIWAGVSSCTTLPWGKPQKVKDELKWLVENGPERGLVLGASSSVTPGAPHENLRALIEGLSYYREHGRG